uniref:Nesprin-2 n=2 Tax=Cacopsylla melanoneura TaxID=428564 RepID=A0A8D8Q4G1_9HEMI
MELEQYEPRIVALEETSEELPDENSTLNEMRTTLVVLSRRLDMYLTRIEAVLGETLSPCTSSASELLGEASGTLATSSSSSSLNALDTIDGDHPSMFRRVVRTSLPIQALMLLALGIAYLLPYSEEDYSCTFANNLYRTLEPMIRYDDGPPPI